MYQLKQMNANCMKCPQLVKSRKRVTWGYGDPHSNIMFVGEAPGYLGCDVTGIPFTRDRSGEFFQKMLSEVGLDKNQVYTTNIVKCCTPGNRTPTPQEMESCSIFLQHEIIEVKPKLIVLMGKQAIQVFYPAITSVINNWGRCIEDKVIYSTTFMLIPHPAYIVRNLKDNEHIYLKSFKTIAAINQANEEEHKNDKKNIPY